METKLCVRCNLEFESYYTNKKKNKIAGVCKECKRKYDREYYFNNPDKRKILKYEQQKVRRAAIREYIYNILKNSECKDCGEKRILTLDFDHLGDKEFNISSGVQGDYSITRLKKEIAKCEIRCSNCHRIKSANELNHWKIEYINRDMG